MRQRNLRTYDLQPSVPFCDWWRVAQINLDLASDFSFCILSIEMRENKNQKCDITLKRNTSLSRLVPRVGEDSDSSDGVAALGADCPRLRASLKNTMTSNSPASIVFFFSVWLRGNQRFTETSMGVSVSGITTLPIESSTFALSQSQHLMVKSVASFGTALLIGKLRQYNTGCETRRTRPSSARPKLAST